MKHKSFGKHIETMRADYMSPNRNISYALPATDHYEEDVVTSTVYAGSLRKFLLKCTLFILIVNLSMGTLVSKTKYYEYLPKLDDNLNVNATTYGVRNEYVISNIPHTAGVTPSLYAVITHIRTDSGCVIPRLEVRAYPLQSIIHQEYPKFQNTVVSYSALLDKDTFGCFVDEPNGIIYTLESNAKDYTIGKVHVYYIDESGKFAEIPTIDGYYPDKQVNAFAVYGHIMNHQFLRPIIPMVFFKGHLFFANGRQILTGEEDLRLADGPYTWDIPNLHWLDDCITNLSVINTPLGQNLIVASCNTKTKMGKLTILDFVNNQFNLIHQYDDPIFIGASNFKTAALWEDYKYSLYFSNANNPNGHLEIRRIPLYLTKDDSKQVDWGRFNPQSHEIVYPTKHEDDRSGLFLFQLIVPKNFKDPIETNIENTHCIGTQAAFHLYHGVDNIIFKADWRSVLTAGYLWNSKNLTFELGDLMPYIASDTLIGVVYGTPPLDTNRQVTVTFSYKVSHKQADTKSTGFSIDASLKTGIGAKVDLELLNFEMNAKFGIFSSYKKSVSSIKTITMSYERTLTAKNEDENNTGYMVIARGFNYYDLYQLRAHENDARVKITDNDGVEVLSYAVVPSLNSGSVIDMVKFNLTTNAMEVSNPDPRRWRMYTDGMDRVGSTGKVDSGTLADSYWGKKVLELIATEVNQNNVIQYTSGPLYITDKGSSSVSFATEIEKIKEIEGSFGLTLDVKAKASYFGMGGSSERHLMLGYNWGSTASVSNGEGFKATSNVEASVIMPGIIDSMIVILPQPGTKNKPFWCPNWAWYKGNRPWCITWKASHTLGKIK